MQLFQFRNALGRLVGVPVWRPSGHPPRVRVERQRKPLMRYAWQCGERGGFVSARSRCDARSMIKHAMGLPVKKWRLPIGTRIECINTGRA